MKVQLILLAILLLAIPLVITANDDVDRLLPLTTLSPTAPTQVRAIRKEAPTLVYSIDIQNQILFEAWPEENNKPEQQTFTARTREILGRATKGVWRWKTSSGTEPWWSCGEGYEGKEAKEKAAKIVLATYIGIKQAKYKYAIEVPIWGVLGTMSRESSFDECAIGMHTRFWAYKKGLLKRPARHITHSLDEIFSLIENKEWKKKWGWVDGGLGQILWNKIYKGPLEDLLSVNPGAFLVTEEMAKRASGHKSLNKLRSRIGMPQVNSSDSWAVARPWAFWPGSLSKDYDQKVTKRAYRLGAKESEI